MICDHKMQTLHICETKVDFNSRRSRLPNKPGKLIHVEEFDNRFYDISAASVGNTFAYIFNKFKKGLYVKIANGSLVNFLPFDNKNYTNEFSHLLKPPPGYCNLRDYMTKINQHAVLPPEKWYANNAIFRTDTSKGQANLEVIQLWLQELCNERQIKDIEFFINRRDFPLLKSDRTEAYDHIFGDTPLVSHNFETLAPIISVCGGETFSDIVLPTYEDYTRVWFQEDELIIPPKNKEYPEIKSIEWAEKTPIVIFRGQATGAGFDQHTNQRLKAYAIGAKRPELFDIKFNKFSYRIRKHRSSEYIQELKFPGQFTKAPFMTPQEQSNYKFILNLEGHVAAYRLSYELSFQSCILLAGSRWKLWYSHLIVPWIHYVPVKEDLSDLVEKAEWCLANDKKCKKIAQNAFIFYKKYLNKEYMLDFCQATLNKLANHCGNFNHQPTIPQLTAHDPVKHYKTRCTSIASITPRELPEAKKTFERTIENLTTVGLIIDKFITQLKFTKLPNSLNKFVNVNGCLVLSNQVDGSIVANQVGYFCLNKILLDIPNFLYTFVAKNKFLEELLPSITPDLMLQQCTLQDFKSFVLQVICACLHAQNKVGFVHGKLSMDCIKIVPLMKPKTISYQITPTHNLVHTTNFLCIISDYSEARGVVYNDETNLVESVGNCHLEFSETTDVTDFLWSLSDALKPLNMACWRYFATYILNPFIDNSNVFGTVLNILNSGMEATIWDNKPFSSMQGGNVIYIISQLNGLSHKAALTEVLNHLNKHGTLDHEAEFFRRVQLELFRHRAKWLNEAFANSHLLNEWLKYIFFQTPKRKALKTTRLFHYPKAILSEAINDYTYKKTKTYKGDWITTLDLMYFAARMNIATLDPSSFFAVKPFDLLTNLANTNDRSPKAQVDVIVEEILTETG